MYLPDVKIITEIIESIISTLAIIVGGYWAYLKFIRKRESFPRADIEHKIFYKLIGNGKRLVHLSVIIKNIGEVLLSISSADIRINRIFPLSEELKNKLEKNQQLILEGFNEIFWEYLLEKEITFRENECEIEPIEDQVFDFDVIIDDTIQVIQVYSYFKNVKKLDREIGWSETTFFTINNK